ncbi:LamG-like jellyroll fold domain-containing protein [Botrimarina sp.]|uniref:LamG-like jellyroll fold domain-containing protein n=1 Tax=Botrimarina sp. TaxID=2795802 RepID=UPI0032EDBAAC
MAANRLALSNSCPALLLCLATASAQADLSDGLEVYLPLNETSGFSAADASGNGRAGAVVNRSGNLQNITVDGDPLPNDPLANDTYFWQPGRFGGAFAPAGGPDADGDPESPFSATETHWQGSPFAMVGVNLTNGATTEFGIPAEIQSTAFSYSFHVRMPYNATYSKDVHNRNAGDEIIREGEVLLDAHSVTPNGIGLASADTVFYSEVLPPSSLGDHLGGNRWSFLQVDSNDDLFHHYRAGAVDVRSSTTPSLFDVTPGSEGALVDGDWRHVALVEDYTIGTGGGDSGVQDSFLYIDGQLVNWNRLAGSTAADAIIGAITLGSTSGDRGGDAARLYFDDFAMWSRALTSEEIQLLSQRSLVSILSPTGGDYNADGFVNAADYTVFRDSFGQSITLPNENPAAATPGFVDLEDYDFWVSQYGAQASGSIATPEPSAALLLGAAMLSRIARRRRR